MEKLFQPTDFLKDSDLKKEIRWKTRYRVYFSNQTFCFCFAISVGFTIGLSIVCGVILGMMKIPYYTWFSDQWVTSILNSLYGSWSILLAVVLILLTIDAFMFAFYIGFYREEYWDIVKHMHEDPDGWFL